MDRRIDGKPAHAIVRRGSRYRRRDGVVRATSVERNLLLGATPVGSPAQGSLAGTVYALFPSSRSGGTNAPHHVRRGAANVAIGRALMSDPNF